MDLKIFYDHQDSLNLLERKNSGVYYTPHSIVDEINLKVLEEWKKDNSHPPRVVDQSCGTGIFLWDMAEKISNEWNLPLKEVIEKYIIGSDVDEKAIKIAKSIFGENSNFSVKDGLNITSEDADVSVGNPPYVRIQNLHQNTRDKISEYSWCVGDTDLFIAFLQNSFTNFKVCGFITPNSWLKNKSADLMREEIFNSKKIRWIKNFNDEKIFKGISTYCCSFVFGAPKDDFLLDNDSVRYENKNKYNFFIPDDNNVFIEEVSKRKTRLLDLCDVKIGIATLSDDIYFLSGKQNNGFFEGDNFKIELEITKPCVKASKENVEGRIIFPYDSNLKLLDEKFMIDNYPLAYSYLLSNKEKLSKRDAGKIKNWYAFGRKQGMHKSAKKLLLPPLQKTSKVFETADDSLYISGYGIYPKNNFSIEKLKTIFTSKDIEKWYHICGKPMSSGWRGVNKNCFLNYKVPDNFL